MKRTALVLAICGLLALIGSLQGTGRAAPAPAPPGPAHRGPRLEGGPAVPSAPALTGPPAAHVANDPHWAPNVRVNDDATTYAQQEPSVSVNPLNHLNVVAAQKDERRAPGPGTATKEVWIETSLDGGLTWPFQTHVPMPDNSLPRQSDAAVVFDNNNTVYVNIIGIDGDTYTMVARSTDGGVTWPTPVVNLDSTLGGSDKEWLAVDSNPASPYYHRVYVTWTNFAAGPAFVEKWSSDAGATWNPPGGSNYVTVSYGAYDGGQFSMPVVLPNGNVLATWNDFGGHLAYGISTDGGQSFSNPSHAAVNIFDVNGVPNAQWRLNTIPSTFASPATGTVVSVWADGRNNGKNDIYFTRSTDGGATWAAPARVAHNAAGSSYQVEPWVSAAPGGRFDVIWYDDRDFLPANPNTFHIYASHSTDDGATWAPDEQVTDAATDLNIGIPQGSGWNAAAGDYINVTSADDAAYAVWTDTRSGTNEDIYSSRYTPGGAVTPTPGSPTAIASATPSATLPPTGTPTAPPTATGTTAPTGTATAPPTATASAPPATATATSVTANTPTETALPAASETPTTGPAPSSPSPAASETPAVSETPTATTTPTCNASFSDVNPGDYFYQPVLYLACKGIISGYADGTYRPYNFTTRGQMVKIVVNGFQVPVLEPPPGEHTFADVLQSNPFFVPIEAAAHDGIVSGYGCGSGPSEPCDNLNRPYFRPNAYVTRGQLTKIVVVAAGWMIQNPPTATFSDVPLGSPFYPYIETAVCHSIISGYADGTFRPFNNTIRGQIAKIVYGALTTGVTACGPTVTPSH